MLTPSGKQRNLARVTDPEAALLARVYALILTWGNDDNSRESSESHDADALSKENETQEGKNVERTNRA